MLRLFALGWLGLGTLPAQVEDDARVVTGETEELPEMLPEVSIPWHDSLLELPEWMSQESAEIFQGIRPANHGAGLFPPEIWPLQPEPVPGPLIRDEAWAGNPGGTPGLAGVTPVALEPELLLRYTGSKPEQVLVDPQRLAPGGRISSLVQRWLNDQCVFRTTVLLFGPGQQLPAGFDPQALRREWFGDTGEELLVFYFYGEPQRTLAIFGPEARSRYGGDLLRAVADAAVTEAGRVEGGAEQLERFCYKMSVRLHWMARTAPPPGQAEAATARTGTRAGAMKKAAWAALAAAGLIASGLAFLTWRQRRGQPGRIAPQAGSTDPVMLPELDFKPRFGAPHSGGFSSMVTFSVQAGAGPS